MQMQNMHNFFTLLPVLLTPKRMSLHRKKNIPTFEQLVHCSLCLTLTLWFRIWETPGRCNESTYAWRNTKEMVSSSKRKYMHKWFATMDTSKLIVWYTIWIFNSFSRLWVGTSPWWTTTFCPVLALTFWVEQKVQWSFKIKLKGAPYNIQSLLFNAAVLKETTPNETHASRRRQRIYGCMLWWAAATWAQNPYSRCIPFPTA